MNNQRWFDGGSKRYAEVIAEHLRWTFPTATFCTSGDEGQICATINRESCVLFNGETVPYGAYILAMEFVVGGIKGLLHHKQEISVSDLPSSVVSIFGHIKEQTLPGWLCLALHAPAMYEELKYVRDVCLVSSFSGRGSGSYNLGIRVAKVMNQVLEGQKEEQS